MPGLLEPDARGPLGHGARVRRALRARDAHGRAAASSKRPTPRSAASPRSGRSCDELLATLRRSARPRCTAPTGWRPRRSRRRRPRREHGRRLRLYLKREDLDHTGAHKINNALGQALLTRRLGKSRVIAETGAGQHGVATATACALLGLDVRRVHGRRGHPSPGTQRAADARARCGGPRGHVGHRDAQGRGQRGDARLGHQRRDDPLRAGVRGGPAPVSRRWCATSSGVIGDEAAPQLLAVEGRLPDVAIACVGGGSNAIGLLARFIGEPDVRLVGVEAAGEGLGWPARGGARRRHRRASSTGRARYLLQDDDGQVTEARSVSAGLDYPGIGPQLSALSEAGRLEIVTRDRRRGGRRDALLTRTEGILPALETSHAVAALPRLLAGIEGAGRSPDRRSCCWASRGAATRTWPRSSGSRMSSPGTAPGERRSPRRRRTPTTRPGRDASRARSHAAARRRPRRAHPVCRGRATRTRTPARHRVSRRSMRAPTCSRSACRTRTRSRTARRSSARARRRSRAGTTLERSIELVGRIRAARPGVPLVTMGYVNQVIGRPRRSGAGLRASRAAGASGFILADLTPDEGGPFEAAAAEAGIGVVYLVAPTTAPARRAAVAARSGGFLYCVSLAGVTGARRSLPPGVGRLPRGGEGRVARCRSRSASASRGPRTRGRSPMPAAMASSSRQRSWMRWVRTAATWRAWPRSWRRSTRAPAGASTHGARDRRSAGVPRWDRSRGGTTRRVAWGE